MYISNDTDAYAWFNYEEESLTVRTITQYWPEDISSTQCKHREGRRDASLSMTDARAQSTHNLLLVATRCFVALSMTKLELSVDEELSRSFAPCLPAIIHYINTHIRNNVCILFMERGFQRIPTNSSREGLSTCG